jgi:hypothetical protein
MKLKLLSLFIAIAVCFSFVSCTDKEPKKKSNKTKETTSVTDESLIGAPDYGETIDLDELMTKITVDGVPISLPFTIEDLGEGWSLVETYNAYKLMHNGEYVALVQTEQTDISDTNKIIFNTIGNTKMSGIDIYNFSYEDSGEELLKTFGNPTRFTPKYSNDNMGLEYEDEKNYIYISIVDNKIQTILISA